MIPFSVDVHLFFLLLMALIPLRQLWLLYQQTHYIALARRLRYNGPMYHLFIAANGFSGLILAIIMERWLAWEVWVMALATLWIVVGEIKRFKKIRLIGSKEIEAQQQFIAWAKRKYGLDLLLMAGVSLLVWMV